jgi:dolichol-phosphate mannosyltransferase
VSNPQEAPSVLVVIPSLHEVDDLAAITGRVLEATDDVDILLVDNNSPDGSRSLIDELAAASDRIFVLHRPGRPGLGTAYRAGFGWGLRAGYAFLVELDADGSLRPEQLPALLDAAREADVVLGSRWIHGRGAPHVRARRRLLSTAGSLYARLALDLPFRDITGGYRVFRASALTTLDYHSVEAEGYCFQIEILFRAHEAGLRILEVPIETAGRLAGTSTMSMSLAMRAIARVTVLGIAGLPRRLRGTARPARTGTILGDGSASDSPQVHGGLATAHSLDGRD